MIQTSAISSTLTRYSFKKVLTQPIKTIKKLRIADFQVFSRLADLALDNRRTKIGSQIYSKWGSQNVSFRSVIVNFYSLKRYSTYGSNF